MTIQEILDSKPKSSLIALLLLAPNRSFSGVELSKRLGIPQPKLQLVLSELVKQGSVKTFFKQRAKFYLLNTQSKYFPELKASLQKNKVHYEDELFLALKQLGEVKAVFLSGVFTGKPELPVDVLLVGKINLDKLSKFLINCKKMMGVDINYSIMSADEFASRRDTFDRFIKDIFDYPHLIVLDKLTSSSH
jgi:biotin operon repressor